MSAQPKLRLTPEEYLAIERKAEFKSAFYKGEMFAMLGPASPMPSSHQISTVRLAINWHTVIV